MTRLARGTTHYEGQMMPTYRTIMTLTLLATMLCAAGPSDGADSHEAEHPDTNAVTSGPRQKLTRGIANTLAGWVYLPRAFKDCYVRVGGLLHENTPLIDVPRCGIDATWRIVGREVWGVTELVTFPIKSWPKPNYRSPYGWADYPWEWIHAGEGE